MKLRLLAFSLPCICIGIAISANFAFPEYRPLWLTTLALSVLLAGTCGMLTSRYHDRMTRKKSSSIPVFTPEEAGKFSSAEELHAAVEERKRNRPSSKSEND